MTLSKKLLTMTALAALVIFFAGNAFAMKDSYNYMSPAALQNALDNKADIAIIDIQPADQFKSHHVKGSVQTCAYPAKTVADTEKLNAAILELKKSTKPIVIVCPGGRGGAERSINYMAKQGIAPYRLFILTNGQGGWPYAVESN